MKCRYNKEIIIYLFVGVITTVVSWGAKYIGTFWLDSKIAEQNLGLTIISWMAGVIFGYFANRVWVFQSKEKNMFKEGIKFAGGRLFSGIVEVIVMQIFTVQIKLPNWFSVFICEYIADIESQQKMWYWFCTFWCAVIVTVTNYFFSKKIVFTRKI